MSTNPTINPVDFILSSEFAWEVRRLQRQRAYQLNLTLYRSEGNKTVQVSARELFNPDGTER